MTEARKAALGFTVVLAGLVGLAFVPSPIPVVPPAKDCERWHQIVRLNLILDPQRSDRIFYLAIEAQCDQWRPQPTEVYPP